MSEEAHPYVALPDLEEWIPVLAKLADVLGRDKLHILANDLYNLKHDGMIGEAVIKIFDRQSEVRISRTYR